MFKLLPAAPLRGVVRSWRPAWPAALMLALVACFLGACGGSAPESAPFDETFPLPTPPSGGGGTTTPPPTAPVAPVWRPDAVVYGRTALFGSFPSDLVRFGDTLFATDADAVEGIGARILPFDVSGAAPTPSVIYSTVTIRASDLRDSAGQPGDANAPVGFGFFVNDIHIVTARLGFAVVNAGGSDTAPTLSNVVAFDPTTGAILQVLNLATTYLGTQPLFDSLGVPVLGGQFMQSGAEGLAFSHTTSGFGRLFIAMSNLVFGAPSYGATKLPGTVQVLDVALGSALPMSFAGGGLGSPLVLQTRAYNPVALHVLPVPPVVPGGLPRDRVLVTCAGTTGYDSNFNLVPVTVSNVEVYGAADGAYLGRFDLGLGGLAGIRPAIGRDGVNHLVGFYPSSVTGEIYLLRLDGLQSDPIDATKLGVLRGPLNGIGVAAAQSGGPGGNLTGVALSPDGRTLAVTGFGDLFQSPAIPGQLYLLGLPSNLVTGSLFTPNFAAGSTQFAAVPGRTLGNVVLFPNALGRPDMFVQVSGTLDAANFYFGSGSASLGTLTTYGVIR
ncbi:MAG: hypothetical protein O2894_00580 [Planctomycetota bacterium]|nr:hypothetical protein [Planctomycetota bacterium]